MLRTTSAFLTSLILVLLSGCAVYMATNQPPKRNLAVLKPGTERDLVIAELGAPIISEPVGDGKKEIYTFVQGYNKMTKASRAIFHGAADLFTVCIWEAVGTPLEGAFDGKKISVRIMFDKDGKVTESTTLSIEDPKTKTAMSSNSGEVMPFTSQSNFDLVESNVRWKDHGQYLKEMVGIIQRQWFRILEESRKTPPRGSHVTITFQINSKGETEILKVEDAGAGKTGVFACQNAITYPQPYRKWTNQMVAALGDTQELTLAFYYQ